MFNDIPDWIEILFGLLFTVVPAISNWLRKSRRIRHRRIKWGSFEYESHSEDADQS